MTASMKVKNDHNTAVLYQDGHESSICSQGELQLCDSDHAILIIFEYEPLTSHAIPGRKAAAQFLLTSLLISKK
jgi:hypothetical protein